MRPRVWRFCYRIVKGRSWSIDQRNFFRGLEDGGEVEARCREERCVFSCEFVGGVGGGRGVKVRVLRGHKISTVDGKLTPIQYVHRKVGVELPMKNHLIKPVKAGIAREGDLKGEAPWIRRPISWVMLKQGYHLA